MKIKIFAFLLVVLMLVPMIVACGGNKKTDTTSNTNSNTTPTNTNTESNTNSNTESTTNTDSMPKRPCAWHEPFPWQ